MCLKCSITLHNLDSKLTTSSDVDQYKLLNVEEEPLDSHQKHLDVMCFPVLFSDDHFGEFQPREEKLSLAEYVKSRLLNKDSQFRKDLHYIFCHEKKNDSLRQRYIIYSTQKKIGPCL